MNILRYDKLKVVGVIYGTIGTIKFKFAVSDPWIKRNAYVEVYHESAGSVLARIIEVERFSQVSFDDARSISKGEDIKIIDKLTATASIIGYRDERGILQTTRTPLKAGSQVYRAEPTTVKEVLGLKSEEGAYIGILKDHDIKVHLDINNLVQKHVSILAKTGSGKSYAVAVLIEELMKQKIPIVLIDPHGEHSALMHPNIEEDFKLLQKFDVKPKGYSKNIREYSLDDKINPNTHLLSFDNSNFDVRDVVELTTSKTSSAQIGILHNAIIDLSETKSYYTLPDIINAVKKSKNNAKWGIINDLEFLESSGIFSDTSTKMRYIARKEQNTIINLKGMPPIIQEIAVARLAMELFEARKLEIIPPTMMIIEEAHKFCPQETKAISTQMLRNVASEGRKFGLGLCVITQRPAKIDKNVLSQCGTQIILKVTNPNDLKTIVQSVEGLTSSMADEIQRLPVGVALISGGLISVPIMVEIRVRETKDGGKAVDIFSDSSVKQTKLSMENKFNGI